MRSSQTFEIPPYGREMHQDGKLLEKKPSDAPKSYTSGELRKMKKADIFNKLVELDYDIKELQKLNRWKMVGLLLTHSDTAMDQNQMDENR